MHPHAKLIESFYDAFKRRDAEAMAACYHPDIHFSDPVFPDLRGPRAGGMWRMLLAKKESDLVTEASGVTADESRGAAHWEARYSFPSVGTGRKVHNKIDAEFEFRDGKIIRHVDRFDLYAWTKMALGPVGFLLGWTPFFQKALRGKAIAQLDRFLAG